MTPMTPMSCTFQPDAYQQNVVELFCSLQIMLAVGPRYNKFVENGGMCICLLGLKKPVSLSNCHLPASAVVFLS